MRDEEKKISAPEAPESKDSAKDTTAGEAEALRKAKAKERRQHPFDGTKRGM